MNVPRKIAGSAVATALAVITVVSGVGPASASSAGRTAARAPHQVRASSTPASGISYEYYSNFEQLGSGDLDDWKNSYATGCTSGCRPLSTGSHEYDEATDITPGGFVPTEPIATALCQVDAYQVNAFIDWSSQNVSPVYPQPGYPGYDTRTPYGESNPYFGPWYGSFPDPTDAALQFGQAPTSGSRNDGDASACPTNYWVTGETLNGPVYSHDELTTCGSPAFDGMPSLVTGTPLNFSFPAELTAGGTLVGWPGAQPPVANPSGTGYVSYPYGYNKDPWGDCATDALDAPTFADPQSPDLGVQVSMPPTASLATLIESHKIAGCIYTGPTMLRFSFNSTTGVDSMTIWSPLTKDTYASRGANCGTIGVNGDLDNEVNRTGQVIAGKLAKVRLTSPEAIWVQALPTDPSDPNYWATVPAAEAGAPVPGCIDPWASQSVGTDEQSCTEGDAIIGGAVGGRVSVGAENDVVISRSLVYSCALVGSGTDPQYSSSLSGCATSRVELGLLADQDIWLNNQVSAPLCTDDSDLSSASLQWANLVPDCDVQDPIVDAVAVAPSGFFEVENWLYGNAQEGTLTLNGALAVNNAGQFGAIGPGGLLSGALLALNYDARLADEPPPGFGSGV